MMVQLVDSIFIGMLGVNELAVHGITLPFQAAFTGVQVGMGVAATSIISQAVGAQDSRKASSMATLCRSGREWSLSRLLCLSPGLYLVTGYFMRSSLMFLSQQYQLLFDCLQSVLACLVIECIERRAAIL